MIYSNGHEGTTAGRSYVKQRKNTHQKSESVNDKMHNTHTPTKRLTKPTKDHQVVIPRKNTRLMWRMRTTTEQQVTVDRTTASTNISHYF